MARGGYRIFDADTHIIEPAEPIEAYLSAADRQRLDAAGPLVQRAPVSLGALADAEHWPRRSPEQLLEPRAAFRQWTPAHILVAITQDVEQDDRDRVLLLVTGKPPRPESERPHARGAIRAAVADWLAGSRHSSAIAAVRAAHPRHGGAGALYIVLKRPRTL